MNPSSWLILRSHHHHVCPFTTRQTLVQRPDGSMHFQFQYTEEDSAKNLWAYITTILGVLCCRTNIHLADGRGMLLKYILSYVTKMHEAATVEGLYCNDVTGYQAANSFLRSVNPLAPEMIFQLSNIKVAWTDKLTKQFQAPHSSQEQSNVVYQLYLRWERKDEDQSLLQWLCSYSVWSGKTFGYKRKTRR